LDWENPEGDDYPFDLTKPLPLVNIENHQKVPVDYFFKNDLKYLRGGILTMTYTTSLTKTKATQYDHLGIKDTLLNIWSLVKVSYDKHALWGISHRREQFRRVDNELYRFKEGDFLRLRINEIEDMLLLVSQKWLTNLSGDDISDFAIALRMFTRILVIQKRVEDLQLGVESYQKKINVTKPETTKYGIMKRDPYTPYQDPQGFIYVDDSERNRLMCLDELYNFSDGTLTRLQTSLGDITKNILMEYLPKRRCSKLKKKRANIIIKVIDKKLKERRMMSSLENQNRRDLPRDISLDSVEVLRYEKRSKVRLKGKVPTEMELVLEQTQQGTSYEVSVSIEGVEELKRKVKTNGEKKEALLKLWQKQSQHIYCQNHKDD
nr:hypothetical protein [Tanacetum cinerariifolium]